MKSCCFDALEGFTYGHKMFSISVKLSLIPSIILRSDINLSTSWCRKYQWACLGKRMFLQSGTAEFTRHLLLHLLTSRPFHCMFIISTITALLMNSLGLICCTHKNIHRKHIEQLVLFQLWIPTLILLNTWNVWPESMQS